MMWEMLYCVVFFLLPLVGMFTAIAVRAFGNEGEVVGEIEKDVELVEELGVAVNGLYRKRHYCGGIRSCESLDQGALVIDFYAYRELGIIRVLKRKMNARDGPMILVNREDTS